MAEVLGIVTGSIALLEVAGRLGGRVLKLKQLFDELREVPDTIRNLMEQVAVVEPILDQMDDNLASSAGTSSLTWPLLRNDPAALQSLEYCRRTKDELAMLVEELSSEIAATKRSKRNRARAKVYLGKEALARCERRLQLALALLQNAQSFYTQALVKVQPDIIMSRMAALFPPTGETPQVVEVEEEDEVVDEEGVVLLQRARPRKPAQRWTSKTHTTVWSLPYALSILGKYAVTKSDKSSTFTSVSSYRATIAPPKWLVGRCWDFCLSNASNGWDFGLRAYQVVDYESDVFKCIRKDDVLGLQRLFETRAASPFAVDQFGRSLLQSPASPFAAVTRAPRIAPDLAGVENYDVHVFPDSDHSIYFHNANRIVYDKLSNWLINAFNGEWVKVNDAKPKIES
ncbi:hypothetical protein BN1723_004568 [Verticillium longisporum]|uniref:Fungal N-terminal domain-containing protein n=1 Tax=Verticillium longisporum TaxID=100787 RepID=A0A0G4MYZ9_VERLO|nr:hypothetical protein BN1723_004568 [Verticillium longisporum]